LSAGGRLLVRLEGRLPVQVYGYRVAPDRLARLVDLMRDAAGSTAPPPPFEPAAVAPEPAEAVVPPTDAEHTEESVVPWAASEEEATADEPTQAAAVVEVTPSGACDPAGPAPVSEIGAACPTPAGPELANGVHHNGTAVGDAPAPAIHTAQVAPGKVQHVAQAWATPPRSELLERLDAAPFEVRCFGAREVRHVASGQLMYPAAGCRDKPFELLFLLAAHPVDGVRGELVVDSLWPKKQPQDPGAEFRKNRSRLREYLQGVVPDLGDPIPKGSPTIPAVLDPSVVASDVHRFLELLRLARSAPPDQAIAAYEAALGLYAGDLLDRADVPLWFWLYDGPEVADVRRAEYRRLHQEARRKLADLYAAGNDDAELRRAEEMYIGLTGELAEDEQLWAALFRTNAKRGDRLRLDASVRRLRSALAELAEDGDGPDAIAMPPGLGRLIDELRVQLVSNGRTTGDAPTM
jgi:DNA-binding SARP family transcriptional activator